MRTACALAQLARSSAVLHPLARPGSGEIKLDDRSRADRAFDRDRAAGLLRQAVHHRQAETRSFADFFGGEEGFDDAVQNLRRDARPSSATAITT